MTSPVENAGNVAGQFRLSTSALPANRRFSAFEELSHGFFPVDFDCPDADAFTCSFDLRRAGEIVAFDIDTSRLVARSSKRADVSGRDTVCLQIVKRGMVQYDFPGATHTARTGEAILAPAIADGLQTAEYGDGSIVRALQVERSLLRPLLGNSGPRSITPVNARLPLLGLLECWMDQLPMIVEAQDPRMVAMFSRHTVDLMAALLNPSSDDMREAIEAGGLRAARLHAIIGSIARNAAQPDFGAAALSQELGISMRYIRLLLEQTGKTFSEHLLEERLQLAWKMLRDPRWSRSSIADVALRAGFGDLSYFNRTFRRRFGDSPSTVRAEALQKSNGKGS